jgi:hypothetical protein
MAKTQVSDPPTGNAANGSGPMSGSRDHSSGWPTWLRRTVIGVTLVVAAGLLVFSYRSADHGTNTKDADPAIVRQFPPPGGTAPRQTTVGADLKPGYDGRLTVNGVAIPEGDMVGARDPQTVSADDLAANGLRPNNHNSVYFTPGPGKAIEKFDPGTVRISVQYFKDRQNHQGGRVISWTINVV